MVSDLFLCFALISFCSICLTVSSLSFSFSFRVTETEEREGLKIGEGKEKVILAFWALYFINFKVNLQAANGR